MTQRKGTAANSLSAAQTLRTLGLLESRQVELQPKGGGGSEREGENTQLHTDHDAKLCLEQTDKMTQLICSLGPGQTGLRRWFSCPAAGEEQLCHNVALEMRFYDRCWQKKVTFLKF